MLQIKLQLKGKNSYLFYFFDFPESAGFGLMCEQGSLDTLREIITMEKEASHYHGWEVFYFMICLFVMQSSRETLIFSRYQPIGCFAFYVFSDFKIVLVFSIYCKNDGSADIWASNQHGEVGVVGYFPPLNQADSVLLVVLSAQGCL